jgi:branched-chain amino acid transport system substrate-binding protein
MLIPGVRTRAWAFRVSLVGGLILGLVGMSILAGCDRQEPIKIGFIGGLTGKLADLGITGRNGVILAVEQINRAGGIDGRPVVLIVRDDRQDPRAARRAAKALIDEGVAAIIGPMTSTVAAVTVPQANRHRVLMISPTTSTNALSGRDDYFFRVTSPNQSETDHLVRYAIRRLSLKRMVAVYDLANRAYSAEYFNNFKTAFMAAGGRSVTGISFASTRPVNYTALARRMLGFKPEGVLVVTGAVDAAMICQQLRKLGARLPVVSCGWAMTADLIRNGGPAVEGVVFSALINTNLRTERYLRFKKAFRGRFGVEPNFAAVCGYDAARVLFTALKNGPADRLKQTIIRIGRFQGVQGPFEIDKFGDAVHRRFLLVVHQGRFAVRRH